MLFAFLSLLFTAIMSINEVDSKTLNIGDLQLEIKKTSSNAGKAMFYLEQSARYSVYSIVEEIIGNIDICNPSYQENIANLLKQKLKSHTSQYPNINFPENNYEITIIMDGELLIANAKSNLKIPFSKGYYTINPSFSIPFGYDINELCN